MAEPDSAELPEPTPEIVEGPPQGAPLPDALPVIALRDAVAFPGGVTPLAIADERSARTIDEVMNAPVRIVALVAARDPEVEQPGPDQLFEIGTAGLVQRMLRAPDGTMRVLLEGLDRVRLGPYDQTEPHLVARVEPLPDVGGDSPEVQALSRNLTALFSRVIGLVPHLPDELQAALTTVESPSTLSYLVASSMRLSLEERQELLEQVHVEERLRRLTVLVNRELEVLESREIEQDVLADMDKNQREHLLRQQLQAIRAELGEGDEEAAEIAEASGRGLRRSISATWCARPWSARSAAWNGSRRSRRSDRSSAPTST